ncbi:MAG: acyl-CoA dehydrogenase family protein [Parvularculaceae bacterium]
MQPHRPRANLQTHDVVNQPPAFTDVNLFENDAALIGALEARGGGAHRKTLSAFGRQCGSEEARAWAMEANRNPPRLDAFDRYGRRLDEVSFHPSYHLLMDMGFAAGVAAGAWRAHEAGHALHAGLLFLMTQADAGVCCPMSMTYAAVPAIQRGLAHDPDAAEVWIDRATELDYDARVLPATDKRAVTVGMAMTEKQGGSDVRANTTRAEKVGDAWALTGHKWFCSAPMSDAFLTLAQTDEGLTCFLAPRWKPDGARNAIHLMRLKDKLGDRSNASAEIEFHGAYAVRLGAQGRGVRTIVDMVQLTRFDCAVGSAGAMRIALAEALWRTEHRSAFGRKLIDQPAMAGVLADLVLDCEAATALAFSLAAALDAAADDDMAAAYARLATPIAKYWICKRQTPFVGEVLECHGGDGYVETGPTPRYFRAAPLNAVWEGSGNVVALDALRAVESEPRAFEAVAAALAIAQGSNAHFDAHARRIPRWLEPGALNPATVRRFAEDLGLALAAAALKDAAPDAVFDGFCAARLDPAARGAGYGASGATLDAPGLIARAAPF